MSSRSRASCLDAWVFPFTIERSLPLLGATADSGRVWDVAVVAQRHMKGSAPWRVAGEGQAGLIGAYAALYEPSIGEIVLVNPPASHQPRKQDEPYGPALLNVLRVLDVPEALGCLAPRPLSLVGADDKAFEKTKIFYHLANSSDQLKRVGHKIDSEYGTVRGPRLACSRRELEGE